MGKRIAVGCDHGGFGLKERLVDYLSKKGYSVKDFGAYTKDPCDYPLVGFKVAEAVSGGAFKRAILVCKSGIGMAIVANKLPGVRSAVCNTVAQAESSRQHNDTNVLSLAAEYIDFSGAKKVTDVWLNTESLGGRHKRRVKQIERLEKK